MATYNGAKYIREQVDSILRQEFRENKDVELELIVSDDGSTDETIAILKGYNDPRIHICQHHTERHHRHNQALFAATENFGNALAKATGDYIFFADQDDVWLPQRLDVQLVNLCKSGGVNCCAFEITDESLNRIGEVHYEHEPFWKLRRQYAVYGFSIGMERKMLRYLLPMPHVPQHDLFIQLVAQRLGCLYFTDTVLARHRWSGQHNVSSSGHAPMAFRLYHRLRLMTIALWRAWTR